AFLRQRFTRAQLHKRGRRGILDSERADVRQREIEVAGVGKTGGQDGRQAARDQPRDAFDVCEAEGASREARSRRSAPSAAERVSTLSRDEPDPMSPTRQIFPASGPRPAPISMLYRSSRCFLTAASSIPSGTFTAFSDQS